MKHIAFALVTLLLVGCNTKTQVTGTVTFEDGTPLKVGSVVFTSDVMSARGQLNEQGRYTLESTGADDGVPNGSYKVTVMGAVEETGTDAQGQRRTQQLIDSKFQSPDSSGLSCEVSGTTTYDFKVSPPGR